MATVSDSLETTIRELVDRQQITACLHRFLAVAAKRLGHLFPDLPQQSGYFKRTRASPAVGRARPRS
jgi:hypothetical protein